MKNEIIINIQKVINYIEKHMDSKLELDTIAESVHYSKYHLHRMFTETVGITIHDYVLRRKLTEAAKLLIFSKKPILEIALICGYESQAAFTVAFKAMYKLPPAEYRRKQLFYPLQLRFSLENEFKDLEITKSKIRFAELSDIPAWMKLVYMVIDGYPKFDKADYIEKLKLSIMKQQALILMNNNTAIGIMVFSYDNGSIEFFGIHPQYRGIEIQKAFLDKLMEEFIPNKEISITTYRAGDRADTGYRKTLKQLGFSEKELLIEFGYPTQRFVLSPQMEEVCLNERTTKCFCKKF